MNISLLNADIFSNIFFIFVAILMLLLLVTVHEFGHYIVGSKLGFKINEFSVGFGKAIWSKVNKKGVKISLRIFPLGGYCAFEAEDEEQKDNPLAFNNQKPWKRMLVQAAGAVFNILFAIIFSFIFLLSYGYDVMQVVSIPEGSQNASIIQVGDVVYAINGTKINFVNEDSLNSLFAEAVAADPAAPVVLTIKRDGVIMEKTVLFQQETELVNGENVTSYKLNITFGNYPQPFFEALANTIPFVFGWAWIVLKSFWLLITFRMSLTDVNGPIGMIGFMADVTSKSFSNILFLIPLLSINLGVFNLIPFPALDGMKMVFTGIEWIRKKPFNRNFEAYFHFGGLVFLLLFVVVVDVINLIL